MSRKKKIFDIEMPDEPLEAPAKVAPRRGPMASAIAENAEALQARKSTAEKIRAENDALAHEFVAAKEAGHVVVAVPLDEVHTNLLVRDRLPGEDAELADLVTSIQELGLSNPIRVVPRSDRGYELVQGFRRLSAYRQLRSADGDAGWHQIPALVVPGEADVAGLYRRMVDENVIRKDLSFAEMAYAARNYAADPATDAADLSAAVAALFQSAPYSKRSYIRSFARLLEVLEDVLNHATAIPRALGVALARVLDSDPTLVDLVRSDLRSMPQPTAEDELAVLRRYAGQGGATAGQDEPQAKSVAKTKKAANAKTTFQVETGSGQIKVTAGVGRLEIKGGKDFSGVPRARLERAVAELMRRMS